MTLDEVNELAWQLLQQLAINTPEEVRRGTRASPMLSLAGEGDYALQRLVQRTAGDQRMPQGWDLEVLDVYHQAISMGLIAPGVSGQQLNWNAHSGPFHFTRRGEQYFGEDAEVPPYFTGHLRQRLLEIQNEVGLQDAQITLLLEAQRCWALKVHRAAIVLIGLAAEDLCLELLDNLATYPLPPRSGHALYSDSVQMTDTSKAFAARWSPGLRILGQLKGKLRPLGKGQDWWEVWETVPGAIQSYGEAVRLARNVAAHDPEREFTSAEIGLLLAASPTHFLVLARLTAQLADANLVATWPDLNQ